MSCPICGEEMSPAFTATVLCKHEAKFDYCKSCGFLNARKPHWLDEAYSSAISSTDTGLVMRNIRIAEKLAALLYFVMGDRGEGRYLDAAGGSGLLTRLMRDYGFDFYWSDKYCDNLMARGFEFNEDSGPCRAITAFEAMEHLEDPVKFITDGLSQSKSDTFIFSTVLFEGAPPPPDQWWYYALETGQHIGFFQRKTLETIGKRLGMRFFSAGGLHILTKKNISPLLLRICVSRASSFFSHLTNKALGGKVWSDHLLMIDRINNSQ